MEQIRLNKKLIQTISPAKVAMYLDYKGWNKTKEAEGIASIWSRVFQNNKVAILLPLNKDFADFEIKIEELLLVLAKVEKRPEAEILKALVNLSVIAQINNRELIDIKMESTEGEKSDKHEAPAKATGSVLKSLQDLFGSIGDSISKRAKKRLLKTDIKSELNLSLLDTFQGSFGVRIGLGVYREYKQLNFLEEPAAQEAAQDFMNLIAASSNNPETLRKEIEKFRGEPSIKFKNFIRNLIALDSNLVLEWGSIDPNKGAIVKFPLYKIVEAFDIIRKIELENPYQYEVIGRLVVGGVGESKDKRIFILIDEVDRKEYKGHISVQLINSLNNYIELDKVYKATIEETLGTNESTGEEIKLYTLVGLQELNTTS